MNIKKWYLPSEVIIHNKFQDIWIVINNKILDITALVKKYVNNSGDSKECELMPEIKYLVALAGKDLSHMFDSSGELRTYIHPTTYKRVAFLPFGPIPGAKPDDLPSDWAKRADAHWWRSDEYLIGCVTKNPRPVRITNTLTGNTIILMVCEEETLHEIKELRYRPYNPHYASYEWSYLGRKLCDYKTLTQNGIKDERRRFTEAGLPESTFIPMVLISFIDDITVDPPLMK